MTRMTYANFLLRDGRRVCLRCAPRPAFNDCQAFAWAVDKWTHHSWCGYMAITEAVALRFLSLRQPEYAVEAL